jgi:hypothetical protein
MLRRDDDHSSSPAIADGIKRPTRKLRTGRSDSASLFGLAPCGVLPATRVATGAVRSYRTFSPLPTLTLAGEGGGIFSVPLSFGLPRPGVTRRTALRSSDFPLAFAPFGRYWRSRLPLSSRRLGGLAAPTRAKAPLSFVTIGRACRAEAREAREGGRSSVPLRRISHHPPVRFRIAPASCTDCCAACRSLRPSLRCSNCSRGVCRRGTSAQRTP